MTELPRNTDGTLASYVWPGGYPVAYYAEDGTTFCPDCANQTDAEPPITAVDANWEDANLYCDGCGQRIESAYAEDETPNPTIKVRTR
jgi:hypothetical protein